MRKFVVGLLSTAALIVGTVAAGAQGTVKIGLIMPYSGQFADTATQMDNAIKLYVKQHGDTVAGKKIQAIELEGDWADERDQEILADLKRPLQRRAMTAVRHGNSRGGRTASVGITRARNRRYLCCGPFLHTCERGFAASSVL